MVATGKEWYVEVQEVKRFQVSASNLSPAEKSCLEPLQTNCSRPPYPQKVKSLFQALNHLIAPALTCNSFCLSVTASNTLRHCQQYLRRLVYFLPVKANVRC